MNKLWTDDGLLDYLYWQTQDKKTLKKINELIHDIDRNGPLEGTGKPERLRYCEVFSKRIDHVNRLVYVIDAHGNLVILSCRGHYEE